VSLEAATPPGRARWVNHGEQAIYQSDWVSLHLADVELPDGTRLDHHVVRVPAHAVATVVVVDDELLMMWRHRFITDTWGWEIPAGRVDPGEDRVEAAARETLEETGWRPGPLTHLVSYHPSNGLTDQHFHVFGATEATHVGEPTDRNEADMVAWMPIDTVREHLRAGQLGDGLSFSAVAWWLAVGRH